MPATTDLLFANFSNKLGRIITGRNCSLLDDGRQRRHFGVEIEACDYASSSYLDEDTAYGAINELFSPFDSIGEDLFKVKDDCSLVGNHFEMVTSPMTMNLLKSLNWEDFFSLLRNADYKQTNFNEYDKAGIHVHVNRRSLHHPFEAHWRLLQRTMTLFVDLHVVLRASGMIGVELHTVCTTTLTSTLKRLKTATIATLDGNTHPIFGLMTLDTRLLTSALPEHGN